MSLSKNLERKILPGLLFLAFTFYIFSRYFFRSAQGLGLNTQDFEIFGVYLLAILNGVVFLFLRSTVLRIVLFVLGIFFALLMILPVAFICFDQCPQNSQIILILTVLSSFIYLSVFVWSMFQNKTVKGVILAVLAVLYFVSLVTSTGFNP